jgi:plasmid stabilization system protein ParE
VLARSATPEGNVGMTETGDELPTVSITWTRAAVRSLSRVLAFLATEPHANPVARVEEILRAIEDLRYVPQSRPVQRIRNGRVFRRLVVHGRFIVFYVWFPPPRGTGGARVSIRAVKHGACREPFAGVREPSPAYCVSKAAQTV